MKILYATSEAAPFIKSGGLADVLGALPPEISRNEEADVAVVLPYYSKIKNNSELNIEYITSFTMPLSWRESYVGIFKAEVVSKAAPGKKKAKVTYYFIDNEGYFGRDAIYGHLDDGERFAYFSKAVLEMCVRLNLNPQIIHCNDWQTGFVPLFLKAFYSENLSDVKIVYTIHNIEYQGKADEGFLSDVLGVSEEWRNVCTHSGMINAMKTAIVLADKITTVSETYASEIKYEYFSSGLDRILTENQYKTCGIINGIDMELFNPSTDKKLPFNYRPSNMAGKAKCKALLQERLGLPIREDVPVVAMITRLVKHKGLELVEWVADNLSTMGIQFVVLGTGDTHYEDMFRFLSFVHPDSVSANIMFDASLASLVYAGADFLLMPSKSEPCGLSQLIAMRYGTVPIVRETGGLVDTVSPLNIETLDGRGFTFKLFNAHDMLNAVERARDFFYDGNKLKKHRVNIMKIDSGWQESAQKYLALYKEIATT